MLCVELCGVSLWSWCCFGGRGVVWCVCVFVCVFVCVLRHAEKNVGKAVCGSKKNVPRVYIQNVPVYAGTTRTCVETCARGAGIHEDILNVHTETF